MTVYTGLLDEDATTIDGIPLGHGALFSRDMFELMPDETTCRCGEIQHEWGPDVMCPASGNHFRWQPGDQVARFDSFTPSYVGEVRCG